VEDGTISSVARHLRRSFERLPLDRWIVGGLGVDVSDEGESFEGAGWKTEQSARWLVIYAARSNGFLWIVGSLDGWELTCPTKGSHSRELGGRRNNQLVGASFTPLVRTASFGSLDRWIVGSLDRWIVGRFGVDLSENMIDSP
jgi:hypothetical protein